MSAATTIMSRRMLRTGRALLLALPCAAGAPGAMAQDAPATPVIFAAKADIAAAMVKAKAAIKPGQTTGSVPVLMFDGYRANLEYRIGPAGAAAHPGQIEMFQVVEGSGTLTMGGTLEKSATGNVIVGGADRHVAAGDVFVVPANTPHGFNQVDGHLALITIKLPAPGAK